MRSITAKALKEMLDKQEDIQLIDVREDFEHDEFNIGGILVPLGSLVQQSGKVEKDKPVIIYCHKGIRSQIAIQRLQDKFPYKNLINLVGGIEAWRKEFGI